jgi:SAM-dependent methyltransferase
MRRFVRPETFDLAISIFTSFGLFEKAEDNRLVLENIHTSLKPGGVFVLDILGKEILAAKFQPTRSSALPDGRTLIQRVEIVDNWSRVESNWIYLENGQASTFPIRLWLYSGHEIRGLLKSVGFSDISIHGDLDGGPYGPVARRLVVVAKK